MQGMTSTSCRYVINAFRRFAIAAYVNLDHFVARKSQRGSIISDLHSHPALKSS